MLPDHLLPMLQVQDKATGEIVTQILNFLDSLGGLTNMTVDSVEQFLQIRGIIKPSQPFSEAKHQEINYLTNESNFLNEKQLD